MPFIDREARLLRAAFLKPFDPATPPHYPPDLLLEPEHLDIDLFVDVAKKVAYGTVTTTVVARTEGADDLALDAVNLEDIALRDADGRALNWHYDGQKLSINWPTPFALGERRRVAVTYRAVNPVDGLIFSQPDDAYPDLGWYAVTDHETERARYWLPCIDLPNVRTQLDFRLRAESRFAILANGYLVDEVEHGDGTKTAHWRLEQLCPSYLICFAIGDFVRVDDGAFDDGEKEIPLAYFCTHEHTADDLRRAFDSTAKMMAWMTEKLAMPFPYPKYYQFAVPGVSGAMENISLVSWNDRVVQDETLSLEDKYWADSVNLHEMAHSYFGDAIVCRDFAHTWLKESWAVYMVQCWREDTSTREARDYVYFNDLNRYLHEADNRYKRPIVTRHFQSSWEIFDAHTYPGGACRLHTLRKEISDEVFWAAVRDYLQRYYGKVVETDHFRLVMEEHSGRSLGQFFDQWFFTAGYPDLEVSFRYDEQARQGLFEIVQQQVDKENNIPPFVLTTELGWIIDGDEKRRTVRLDRERQTFIVRMDVMPEQVRFDPDSKVLHKLSFNPGDPLLGKQLTDATDVIGRIQAAQELIKTARQSNIQAVIAAYVNESFWGVRCAMANALAEANHETAVAGLARLVEIEQDPMVMATLFRAAGNYRDDRIAEVLRDRLENELPYRAREAALESLGKQRQAAPLDILMAAAQQESYNGLVQSGALRGLAESRHEEALDQLLQRVPYGATPLRARAAAVSGLGDIGKGEEKARREQIIETLIDLLRDPWWPVHTSAALALQHMKAVEALPALEAHAKSLSYQYQVIAQRLLQALRESDKTDGSALKKQVEDLQQRLRKLEDMVEKMAAQSAADSESNE